jgi:nicotinic acid mononucleotide adenylyltransferase
VSADNRPEPKGSAYCQRSRYASPVVARIARRLDRIFDSLSSLPYLGEEVLRDFSYFRGLFFESLEHIDGKIATGRLRPLDLRGFPREIHYNLRDARIGVFIGSFDPFQMTHLATALRFLGSDSSEADVVFVIPEGAFDKRKPGKTEYRFRFEVLKRQIAGVLDPLIVPLDIGEGADTIEIVKRLLALHPGSSLKLTHLIGSDVLPIAARLLADDLAAWRKAADENGIDFHFSLHVARRTKKAVTSSLARVVRELGVRLVVDRSLIGTPSSTAFRREGAISLVLPTEDILSRLELLFRYGMYRPWSAAPDSRGRGRPLGPEYEI